MARVIIAQLQLLLPGISLTLNEVQIHHNSEILSFLMFLELYQANFCKLQITVDVYFQPRYISEQWMGDHPGDCSALCIVLGVIVKYDFIHIESVDSVHTDRHQSISLELRCRWLISLGIELFIKL